jgi:hypothetical protein
VDRIETKRQNIIKDREEALRVRDVTRYKMGQPTDDSDPIFANKVVVSIDQDAGSGPKWDEFQNNHTAMRKRTNEIFLKIANKLMTRLRAGKRLQKIKDKL